MIRCRKNEARIVLLLGEQNLKCVTMMLTFKQMKSRESLFISLGFSGQLLLATELTIMKRLFCAQFSGIRFSRVTLPVVVLITAVRPPGRT